MKLLHISDIHLYAFEFTRREFLTKSLFTNVNHLFRRQFTHCHKPLMQLITDFKRLEITHLLVSGDLTTTGSKKEFLLVKNLFELIKAQDVKIFALPGNHDVNDSQLFRLLNSVLQLPKEPYAHTSKIQHCQLDMHYHLILIDSTKVNTGINAEGVFSSQMQKDLDKCLSSIDSQDNIIIANHFPITTYKNRKNLIGRDLLHGTLNKYPNVALYLHGHRHRYESQKQSFNIVDAGCICNKKSPSACVFELQKGQIQLIPMVYTSQKWLQNDKQKELIPL